MGISKTGWKPYAAIISLAIALPAGAADPGFRFGRTGFGPGLHILDDQVPAGIAMGKSRPWGLSLTQEFYAGKAFRLRLDGDAAWADAEEKCFICMDFGASGHYYWKTRYASAGLRIAPRTGHLWDGFGLEIGYTWFLYRWGISEEGWDSPYPSGNFLVGDYLSHQMILGSDYDLPFRLLGIPLAFELGAHMTLAAHNTFTPRFTRGPGEFPFPSYPLAFHLSLRWER